MTFANSWSSNIPAVETKGGTGNAAYVVGDMLYSDATNNLARRAIGTTGQILTVVGGVPNWASAAAGGGSLVLLNNTVATGASFVSWGNTIITSTFDAYLLQWYNVVPSATGRLWVQVSADNGATWITTATYRGGSQGSPGTLLETGVRVGNAESLVTSFRRLYGTAFVHDPLNASTNTGFMTMGSITGNGNDGIYSYGIVAGTAQANNAIRFIPDSGTISGSFLIYGFAKA